jgi:non-canonical poly(A) RNA polymerase PAPD5/7
MNNRIKIDKAIELKLARDLLAFTDSLSLDSNRVVDQRISVFERVKDHISRRFDRCQIFLFGSAATGVSLESSDIDVLVFEELEAELSDEARLQLVQERLKEIEEDFQQRKDWVRELNYYPKASVPVLKLMVAGGKPDSWLKVDISMETKALHMNFGYQATLLTKNWLDLLPGLSPLLILLKHRLSREGLNRVYSGGLSSYSLFVMIASFLKDYSRTTHGHNYFNMLIELL